MSNKAPHQMTATEILDEAAALEAQGEITDLTRFNYLNFAFYALTGKTIAQGLVAREEAELAAAEEKSPFFIEGKTYEMRSPCDYDCVWRRTVAKRTAKTVTFTDGTRCGITIFDGVESCRPLGRFSMSPILRASKAVG